MRDPERIDDVLEVVSRYWKANPDMRLTQLLWNLRETGHSMPVTISMFYNMEDHRVVEKLLDRLDDDSPVL